MSAAGDTVGRPPVWQAALTAAAFGILAAGSCAGFFEYVPEDPLGRDDRYALLFLVSTALGGGPLVLALFRIWRRRERESWPRAGVAAALALAGAVLAGAGWGGAMIAFEMSAARRAPVLVSCFALFVTGLVIAVGAGELFAVGVIRRIIERRRPA